MPVLVTGARSSAGLGIERFNLVAQNWTSSYSEPEPQSSFVLFFHAIEFHLNALSGLNILLCHGIFAAELINVSREDTQAG